MAFQRYRNARLKESVDMIRELWKGDYVTHHGLVNVENAKLFTPPETTPTIYGAAITEKTARWLASWVDGMITISKPIEELKKMTSAFKEGGGKEKNLRSKYRSLMPQMKRRHWRAPGSNGRIISFPVSLFLK
jgi:coenzyme F420-dependent glucose-6-phosphate dehydrogenase